MNQKVRRTMRNKFLWLLMIVFAVLLIGCNSAEKKESSTQNNATNLPMSNSKKEVLKAGIYGLQTENQGKESAFIEIKANGEFNFSRSVEMSSVSRGEYKLEGDVLVLHDEVSKSVDKFKICNDKLIYLNEGSIPERYSIFKYRDEKSSDSNSKDSPAGTAPNGKGEQKIEFGRYVCGSPEEPTSFAEISFSKDNRFVYELNVLSSFLPRGEFKVDGEDLFLFLDNGEIYTFTIDGKNLISQDNNQWVKKGSVFKFDK